MPSFDERLTQELERAAAPADPADAFILIDRRRAQRAASRRVQAVVLATLVFAGSIGAVVALDRAFRDEATPAIPPATNGLIVVSLSADDGTHLYLLDPTDPSWDPREHPLTHGVSKDTDPAVSPDGRTILFAREKPDRPTALWAIGTDGSNLHRIPQSSAENAQPAWSPDGTMIAYASFAIDSRWIMVATADGGNAHGLRTHGVGPSALVSDPAWSPSGNRIAVVVDDGSPGAWIETIDAESGEAEVLSPALWALGSPAWSPDASALTFTHGGGIVTLHIDTRQITALTTTHPPKALASADLSYVDSRPTWSPDGEWIAFQRSFSPSETFTYVIRPDGTDLHRVGVGGDPAWGATRPSGPTISPTPTTAPSGTPSPDEPGRDIGLGFNLCRIEALRGIDFLGDGANGTAWVGTRLAKDGSCPAETEGQAIAAVDVDGDGAADSWAGPLARCIYCAPFAATDLNADGVLELVVTVQYSATPEYTLFSLQPAGDAAPPALQQVTVAEPGFPAAFRAGKPVSLWAGGDAGFSASIRCEGYPDRPILISTSSFAPVDGPGAKTRAVDVVRLSLRSDGTIEVIDGVSTTEPVTPTSTTPAFTGKACGVAFWPR